MRVARRPKQSIVLPVPCPRCARAGREGHLERELPPEPEKGSPPAAVRPSSSVHCIQCGTVWPNYLAALKELQSGQKLSLDKAEDMLLKAKAYMRGGRNITERLRSAQRRIRKAVEGARNLKQEGAVADIGANLESVIDDLIGGVGDAKEAIKGNVTPFVGGEADPEDREPEEDEPRD